MEYILDPNLFLKISKFIRVFPISHPYHINSRRKYLTLSQLEYLVWAFPKTNIKGTLSEFPYWFWMIRKGQNEKNGLRRLMFSFLKFFFEFSNFSLTFRIPLRKSGWAETWVERGQRAVETFLENSNLKS